MRGIPSDRWILLTLSQYWYYQSIRIYKLELDSPSLWSVNIHTYVRTHARTHAHIHTYNCCLRKYSAYHLLCSTRLPSMSAVLLWSFKCRINLIPCSKYTEVQSRNNQNNFFSHIIAVLQNLIVKVCSFCSLFTISLVKYELVRIYASI